VSPDGPTEPGDTELCADRQRWRFNGQAGTRRAVAPPWLHSLCGALVFPAPTVEKRKSTRGPQPWRRREEEREEEEFFYHYKNDLKRHAHTPSGDAGADLKEEEERSLIVDLKSGVQPWGAKHVRDHHPFLWNKAQPN
jgi:hypothetical protein